MKTLKMSLEHGERDSAANSTRRARRDRRRRGLLCIATFVLGAIGIQTAFIAAENLWPEVKHIEFEYKMRQLRARLAENPDRPLVLLLGSSRTLNGLRPQLVMEASSTGSDPFVFNFGMPGAGPIYSSIYLQRLLDRGIRPREVMIEVLPIMLHQYALYGEENWMNFEALTLSELNDIEPLLLNPAIARSRWKDALLRHPYVWGWRSRDRLRKHWRRIDEFGWLSGAPQISDEQRRHFIEISQSAFLPARLNFEVTEIAEKATRRLLDICRANGIPASLYLMPEASAFREFYRPEDRVQIDAFLTRISEEYGCHVYDATYWAEDGQFVDSHHLMPDAAATVSRRFAREAVAPFLAESSRTRGGEVIALGRAAEKTR